MRFIRKETRAPTEGEERVKRPKFLWLPTTINGETRWLERAAYREVYWIAKVPPVLLIKATQCGVPTCGWRKIEWVDNDGK